jgi:ABC-2 type transport system permease protein
MKILDNQVGAILWAQWKSVGNRYPREGAGRIFLTTAFSVLWYLGVCAGAVALAWLIPSAPDKDALRRYGAPLLLLGAIYWQVIPIALVSAGVSLELKKLLVYPIPSRYLFGIEVLLRVTTGAEVLILLAGTSVGLWFSRLAPWWGPFFFLPYAALNMFVSAGVRDLLTRLLARKYVRELLVFLFVTLSALPQLLITMFPPQTWSRRQGLLDKVQRFLPGGFPWPWSVASRLALGDGGAADAAWLAAWLLLGCWFGYRQFQRGLRFDESEVRARQEAGRSPAVRGWTEHVFRLPSRILPDPLGALVEKDLRALAGTPRFRLVFFMGFSFGLVIWFPLLLRGGAAASHGVFGRNFLTVVSLYACLLLGDVLFWNTFGFDRGAVQAYFAMPLRLRSVLLAKNITALIWLFLEISLVVLACTLLGLRYPAARIIESFAVTLLMAVFLLGAGNLASIYYPRPINPTHTWRSSSASRVQFYMLFLYPLISLPISLAYLARYAFDTDLAFYVVLGLGLLTAVIFHHVSLETALQVAEQRKERIIETLSRTEGPLS